MCLLLPRGSKGTKNYFPVPNKQGYQKFVHPSSQGPLSLWTTVNILLDLFCKTNLEHKGTLKYWVGVETLKYWP